MKPTATGEVTSAGIERPLAIAESNKGSFL